MAEPGVISAYVERLARALDFDPALVRCVRREVEDHLWEAAAAQGMEDGLEAERRAVMNFGKPHVIAAQFAVASLSRQARKVGIGAVIVILAVFIAMKTRLACYAPMKGQTGPLTTRRPGASRLDGDRGPVRGRTRRVDSTDDAPNPDNSTTVRRVGLESTP